MATLDLLDANDNLSDLQKAENSKQALEEIQTEKFYNTLKSYYSYREADPRFETMAHEDLLDYFYEDPLNSYIPVPSAIIIANLYGKRIPINIIEKYIKDSRDWVNTLTLELDTLNYSRLIEDKYLKYKAKN